MGHEDPMAFLSRIPPSHLLTLASGALSLSCGSDPQTTVESSGGIDSPPPPLESSGDDEIGEATTSTSSSSGALEPPPIKFDLGEIPDAPPADEGCAAVDFLFVIDNSGSMLSAQDNLVSNFPAFIDGIRSTLVNVDSFHVGVVTTDAYAPNAAGCDVLGGLVVRTGGEASSNTSCGPYAAGANYMTEADDLDTSFDCAARVGIEGDAWERPMTAMQEALGTTLAAPGACNEGFVRDDALLVVIIITDEADGPGDTEGSDPIQTSAGVPADWRDAVLAAKHGVEENAVALVLTNYDGGSCPPFDAGADGANIVEFAQLFGDNGFVGGICERDYGPMFESAIGVVSDACESFVAG